MKKFKKIVGIIMLASVMIGLFIFMAQFGIIVALKIWGFAIVLTAIIVAGVYFAVGD